MKIQTMRNYVFVVYRRFDDVDLRGLENNDEVRYKLNEAQEAVSALLDCVNALANKGFNHA